jgi:hypothetical protein
MQAQSRDLRHTPSRDSRHTASVPRQEIHSPGTSHDSNARIPRQILPRPQEASGDAPTPSLPPERYVRRYRTNVTVACDHCKIKRVSKACFHCLQADSAAKSLFPGKMRRKESLFAVHDQVALVQLWPRERRPPWSKFMERSPGSVGKGRAISWLLRHPSHDPGLRCRTDPTSFQITSSEHKHGGFARFVGRCRSSGSLAVLLHPLRMTH